MLQSAICLLYSKPKNIFYGKPSEIDPGLDFKVGVIFHTSLNFTNLYLAFDFMNIQRKYFHLLGLSYRFHFLI